MITDCDTNFVYFSSLIKERPDLKEFWQALEQALQQQGIPYGFIENTNDIWCRDYMPVQLARDKFVQFRYDPSYCHTIEHRPSITDTDQVKLSTGRLAGIDHSPIVLDGGNVVKSQSTAVITDFVFKENKGDREQLTAQLKQTLQVDTLHVIPKQPNDYTGHADGMVRLLDDKTLLVANYGQELNYWKTRYRNALQRTGLDLIEFPGVSTEIKNGKDYTAIGCYINFAWIGKVILFPQFGIPEDETALQTAQNIFSGYDVIPIPSRELAMDGGVLNCVTWNVQV